MITISTVRKAIFIFFVLLFFVGCSKEPEIINDVPEKEENPIEEEEEEQEEETTLGETNYAMPLKGSLPLFIETSHQLHNQESYFIVVSPYDTLSCYSNPYEDYPVCPNEGALILHYDKEGKVINEIFWESEEPKMLITGPEGLYYTGIDVDKNNIVRKLDEDGNIFWETQIGEATHGRVYRIQITNNNSIIGVGRTFDEDSYGDIFTFMLSSSGELLWTTVDKDENQEIPKDIIMTSQNDIIVLADNNDNDHDIGSSIRILKYDSEGNLIWDKDFRYNDWSKGNSIIQQNTETLILAGFSYRSSSTSNVLIAAVDLSGNELWYKEIDDYIHSEYGYIVTKTSEDNAIVIASALQDPTYSITVNSLGNIVSKEEFSIPNNAIPKQIFNWTDEALLFYNTRVSSGGFVHDQVDYIKIEL